MQCKPTNYRKAASGLIQHLQDMQRGNEVVAAADAPRRKSITTTLTNYELKTTKKFVVRNLESA